MYVVILCCICCYTLFSLLFSWASKLAHIKQEVACCQRYYTGTYIYNGSSMTGRSSSSSCMYVTQ